MLRFILLLVLLPASALAQQTDEERLFVYSVGQTEIALELPQGLCRLAAESRPEEADYIKRFENEDETEALFLVAADCDGLTAWRAGGSHRDLTSKLILRGFLRTDPLPGDTVGATARLRQESAASDEADLPGGSLSGLFLVDEIEDLEVGETTAWTTELLDLDQALVFRAFRSTERNPAARQPIETNNDGGAGVTIILGLADSVYRLDLANYTPYAPAEEVLRAAGDALHFPQIRE